MPPWWGARKPKCLDRTLLAAYPSAMEMLDYLVAEDVTGFNANRSHRTPPDLFGADLAGKKLMHADLEDANLEKSDLSGADLSDANLMGARMNGIDGTELKLEGAIARRGRFKDAWMERANLTGADCCQADFSDACLKGTSGTGLRLARARLKDADAAGAHWPDAELAEATFTRTNFVGADLSRADLTDGQGNGALLDKARLDGAKAPGVKLSGASLKSASLVGARLASAVLSEADLTGAALAGADLSGANLADAKLCGADLTGALLANASLAGADLTGAVLDDCDFTGIDPRELSMSAGQIEKLAAFGAGVAAATPTIVRKPRVAVHGSTALALWVNGDVEPEAEEREPVSMRWAVLQGGSIQTGGVLSVDAAAVLAHDVTVVKGLFTLILLLDRPEGPEILRQTVDVAGKVVGIQRTPLGYGPMVVPVLYGDERLVMYGLARRGPTVVQHRDGPDGLVPGWSKSLPTAQGFLGKHHPVLLCKGGVVMPVGANGPEKPLRTPEGFPGRAASAVPTEDGLYVVWVSAATPAGPAGIKSALLQRRGSPETEDVSKAPNVAALDASIWKGRVHLCWLEALSLTERNLMVARAGEDPKRVEFEGDPLDLRFAAGGASPHLVVTTVDDGVVVLDLAGTRIGAVDSSFTPT